jgi:hypothetical protein
MYSQKMVGQNSSPARRDKLKIWVFWRGKRPARPVIPAAAMEPEIFPENRHIPSP